MSTVDYKLGILHGAFVFCSQGKKTNFHIARWYTHISSFAGMGDELALWEWEWMIIMSWTSTPSGGSHNSVFSCCFVYGISSNGVNHFDPRPFNLVIAFLYKFCSVKYIQTSSLLTDTRFHTISTSSSSFYKDSITLTANPVEKKDPIQNQIYIYPF